RRMPKREVRVLGPFGQFVATGVMLALTASPGLVWWPLGLFVPWLFLTVNGIEARRDRRMADERKGQSSCLFARDFDRSVDTWIVRGVYEEFATRYPVRATDHFEYDLHVDREDLSDSAMHIARRIGRSLNGHELNPIAKFDTVADLVI